MKASGDLILPTERRRIAFYLLRSHITTLPSSTVDPVNRAHNGVRVALAAARSRVWAESA